MQHAYRMLGVVHDDQLCDLERLHNFQRLNSKNILADCFRILRHYLAGSERCDVCGSLKQTAKISIGENAAENTVVINDTRGTQSFGTDFNNSIGKLNVFINNRHICASDHHHFDF